MKFSFTLECLVILCQKFLFLFMMNFYFETWYNFWFILILKISIFALILCWPKNQTTTEFEVDVRYWTLMGTGKVQSW